MRGDFITLAPSETRDEVEELIHNFNTMVVQLEERSKMKETMGLALDVQQSLLPQQPLHMEQLDIVGKSIYCDETGGDYFDFFQFPQLGEGRVGIAVGDVVGHGVPAALLMTTVRAFLRSKMAQPGDLAPKVNDISRLICLDTHDSCDYMSMFLTAIDTRSKELQWVRAGHDPALIYDPVKASFKELNGRGAVLGVDSTYNFEENSLLGWSERQIMVIGTDGIWETENSQSEKFGKFRLRQIIRQHRQFPAQEILDAIIHALNEFRGAAPQNDDVTLVVVKAKT